METASVVLLTLVGYKALLIGIGWWASGRNESGEDFFLGGRQLGPWVAGISYSASASSAWTLLGLSGAAYTLGVSVIWVALGSISGMFVAWYYIAKRMREASHADQLLTMTDFFVHDLPPRWQSIIVKSISFIVLFSFVFYVAAQFQGAGTAFAGAFGMPRTEALLLGALIVLIYTWLGGFWAVSLTDAIQGTVMALAAVALPVATLSYLGGVEGFINGLVAVSSPEQLSFTAGNGLLLSLGIIVGGLSIGFGTYGQPHLIVRFMALRDDKARRSAALITAVWYLIVFLGMVFLGLAGRVLNADLTNSEQVFFEVAVSVFPALVAGLLTAAVLSAIMSTADSQLLVSASTLSHDLKLGDRFPGSRLLIGRIAVLIVVVASALVALYMPAQIFSRVLFAWVALGAAFGPLLFARLFGWQIHPLAQLCGIWLGFGLAVGLSWLSDTTGDFAERFLPFALHFFFLYLVRLRS
jgi:sodium/proline symporter